MVTTEVTADILGTGSNFLAQFESSSLLSHIAFRDLTSSALLRGPVSHAQLPSHLYRISHSLHVRGCLPTAHGAAEGSSDSQTEGHGGGTLLPTENG